MNIFLIGYRCTGKTSIGTAIADRIGWRFVDADSYLMAESGKTVAALVREGGWDLFRNMEKKTLKKICEAQNQVVATGGGVVLAWENIDLMKRHGKVIWLRAEPETIHQRMQQDKATPDLRPALTDQENALKEIEDTLLDRTPRYKKAGDYEVSTEGKDVFTLTQEIITLLENNHQLNLQPINGE